MTNPSKAELAAKEFIEFNIEDEFHKKKLAKLSSLTLDAILTRKNPYLYKAKFANTADSFVKAILDATVSSGEETVFGNFLEKIAIHVCQSVRGGRKSAVKAIDLEFEDGNKKYLISIKSGPNWGNSDQIKKLVERFKSAKKTLATSGGSTGIEIICVEACCYGVDSTPDKGTHLKLCGNRFWTLISNGDENLFRQIMVPIGHLAEENSTQLDALYSTKLQDFTTRFTQKYCLNGAINWEQLINYNSNRS